jgi:molecular chaperone GrpE (heat shock protein)
MTEKNPEILNSNENQSLESRVENLEQSLFILKSEILILQKTITKNSVEYFSSDQSSEILDNSENGVANSYEKENSLRIAENIVTQIEPINISDPFASHLTHIKEKFTKFIKVLNNSNADEIHEKMELLAGEILNVVDLFDDYFWGYSLETNQPMSSVIPDNMKQSAEITRKLILEFLSLGMINEIEFPAGSDLNPDMQQFVLDGVNPNKNERMIIETLRPGFVKTCGDGDSIVFRKAIVKIR